MLSHVVDLDRVFAERRLKHRDFVRRAPQRARFMLASKRVAKHARGGEDLVRLGVPVPDTQSEFHAIFGPEGRVPFGDHLVSGALFLAQES